jgi:CMP-N-acetylneuraminic acid synthetase
MYKNKSILAIIPARGGSKGLKNKNLKKINNISLIKRTCNIIRKIKIIDLGIISSDNKKIIYEGNKCGLKSYFIRPKSLSGDRVPDLAVLKHALLTTEKKINKKFDVIIMLQVTSPLRKVSDVQNCIKTLINKKRESVWTVSEVDKKYHPLKQLILNDEKLKYYSKNGSKIIARQQLSKTYIRNGAAYAFTRNCLLKNRILTDKSSAIILRTKQISIDTIKDLTTVKNLLKN